MSRNTFTRLSNPYLVSHVSKSLCQSLQTCVTANPNQQLDDGDLNTPTYPIDLRPSGPGISAQDQPSAGVAQPSFAEFWQIHGNDVLEYIEKCRKQLHRVRQKLRALYGKEITYSLPRSERKAILQQLVSVLVQMAYFTRENRKVQNLFAESFDIDGEQNEQIPSGGPSRPHTDPELDVSQKRDAAPAGPHAFPQSHTTAIERLKTLFDRASASYKLHSTVLKKLSFSCVPNQWHPLALSHIWPLIQESIEQINCFLDDNYFLDEEMEP